MRDQHWPQMSDRHEEPRGLRHTVSEDTPGPLGWANTPKTQPLMGTRIDSRTSVSANRRWWDADAENYHDEHGAFLGAESADGDFLWCPEGLREEDVRLLGEIADRDVLEVGCGSAPCSRWLAAQGARVIGLDLSREMLRRGQVAMARGGPQPGLVQAGAEQLPFADNVFDIACSAFGAVPFVADSAGVMAEVARVLKPGGRWVFSVNHPMRWAFPDDPGPAGLTVMLPYFDRTPYVETESDGTVSYVEHHRTLGDRIREIRDAGLLLVDLIEPEWPEGFDQEWGQWSPLRGHYFPGTAIFCCTNPT